MIRWIFTALGFIALSLLIWFGGPMVAIADSIPLESVAARLLTIIICVLTWVLIQLYKQIKAKKDNEGLIAGLETSSQDASASSHEDTGLLQRNFQEALSVLKKTKLKGIQGEQKLYELPWYIIIGPPGSGKTTALVNSGLRFPLGDQFGKQALRGVGGTRDCDFWFTDESVLVDTAGRYTTQDSDASADKAGWDGFLALLKKHRKRRPINGVLIGISLAELMQQTASERQNHANIIKNRINELYKKLGIHFPVYVLFTKTDLVAGFSEFFDDVGREERQQVWGITFPMDSDKGADGVAASFSGEFDLLISRLNQRLTSRLHQERDMQRRNLIHSFPHQIASLKQVADTFLQETFRPNRYEDRVLLRGVYFTSGTQEGTPIDRIMGSLANIFGLDRQATPLFSGQGRSYFLTNLFKNVIFQESGIAGTDRRIEKQRAWFLRAAYAGAIGITVASTVTWTASYTANANHFEKVKTHLSEYQQETKKLRPKDDLITALPAINALNNASNVYTDSGLTWLSSLGMSKRGAMEPGVDQAYRRALVTDFLPRVTGRIERQLRSGNRQTDFLHSSLKSYLMLNQIHRLDPQFVKDWMEQDWQSELAGDTARLEQLKSHLNTLFESDIPPQKLNTRLVSNIRSVLRKVPLSEQVYNRLKQEAMANGDMGLNLNDSINTPGERPFGSRSDNNRKYEISGLYTAQGFQQIYLADGLKYAKETAHENWVIGENKAVAKIDADLLNKEVRALYLADYIKTWDSALLDMKIARFRNMDHAIDVLENLSGTQSPLRNVLQVLQENTALNSLPSSDGADAAGKLATAFSSKAKKAAKIAKKVKKTGVGSFVKGPGHSVDKAFNSLNQIVEVTPAGTAPIDNIIAQLSEVHGYLSDIAADSSGSAAFQTASTRISGGARDSIGRLRSTASRLQEPVKSWVQDVAKYSWRVVLDKALIHVNNVWKSEVLPEYNRAIRNRYPVANRSTQEINLMDFSRFFGPDGAMDHFYVSYLKPFISTNRNGWRQRSFEHQTLGLSSTTLRSFERAHKVKKTFFSKGDVNPEVSFTMKPTYLDGNISRISLNVDGQKLIYSHGPTRGKNILWPGPDGSSQARISFEASSGSHISRTKEGPWGIFRLLDQAQVKNTPMRDRFKVTFKINGHKANYELKANSVQNPFKLDALKLFNLPERL